MRFLHTADWHLGRIFHQAQLAEDQAHVLDQIEALAISEKVDAILVAGDLYDRAVPPLEAVTLLDRTWKRLVHDAGIPVVAITGNHDSAVRMNFASALLAKSGLHLVSQLEAATKPITIKGVDIFALPYSEPIEVRLWSGRDEVRDHATALKVCLERMRPNFTSRPRVLVAHAFVAGKSPRESERPLSVGGAGEVPAELFGDFDYVALGHLHAPQVVSGKCLYAGSPLKYSFSEAADEKSVLIVDMPESGAPAVRLAMLKPKRNVRDIEGKLDEVLARGREDPAKDDFVRARLTDEGALLNAMGRLREVYPNVLLLERKFLQTGDQPMARGAARKQSSDVDLFRSFFQQVSGSLPTAEDEAVLGKMLNAMSREARETSEVETAP